MRFPRTTSICYLTSRSTAFREADLIMVIGTRMNYIIGHAARRRASTPTPGSCASTSTRTRSPAAPRKLDVGIIGDAKTAADAQLTDGIKGSVTPDSYGTWRDRLRGRNSSKTAEAEEILSNPASPIHPLRLCKEIRDFMDRDGVPLRRRGRRYSNYGRQRDSDVSPPATD